MPIHGKYCGPGHPTHSRYDEVPVDHVDEVCMMHDRCYDSGVGVAICDEAMANSLDDLSDRGHSLGMYGEAARLIMDIKGDDSERRNLAAVIAEEGRSFVTEAPRYGGLTWEAQPQRERKKRSLPQKQQKIEIETPREIVTYANKGGKRRNRRNRRGKQWRKKESVTVMVHPTVKRGKRRRGKGPNAAAVGRRRMFKKTKRNVWRRIDGKLRIDPNRVQSSWHVRSYKGGKGERGIRLTGVDLIDTIAIRNNSGVGVQGANTAGSILTNWVTNTSGTWKLNPLNFVDSRQYQFAQLFQKFRYRKVRFVFDSSQSEFVSGSLLHLTDYDPSADWQSGNATAQNLKVAATHSNRKEMKMNEDSINVFFPRDPEAAYWVKQSGEVRTYTQGQYLLMVCDPASIISGAISYPFTLGRLFMEYDIEFWEDAFGVGTDTETPTPPDEGGQTGSLKWYSSSVPFSTTYAVGWDPLTAAGYAVDSSNVNTTIPPNQGRLDGPNAQSFVSVPNDSSTAGTLAIVGGKAGQIFDVVGWRHLGFGTAPTGLPNTGQPAFITSNCSVNNGRVTFSQKLNTTDFYEFFYVGVTVTADGLCSIKWNSYTAASGWTTLNTWLSHMAVYDMSTIQPSARKCQIVQLMKEGKNIFELFASGLDLCRAPDCGCCQGCRKMLGQKTLEKEKEKEKEQDDEIAHLDHKIEKFTKKFVRIEKEIEDHCSSSDSETEEEEPRWTKRGERERKRQSVEVRVAK